jgi:hypothetical protein
MEYTTFSKSPSEQIHSTDELPMRYQADTLRINKNERKKIKTDQLFICIKFYHNQLICDANYR